MSSRPWAHLSVCLFLSIFSLGLSHAQLMYFSLLYPSQTVAHMPERAQGELVTTLLGKLAEVGEKAQILMGNESDPENLQGLELEVLNPIHEVCVRSLSLLCAIEMFFPHLRCLSVPPGPRPPGIPSGDLCSGQEF